MGKHMKDDKRKLIAYYLDLGWTVARIARELGLAVSTIWREVLGRRVDSTKGYACSNRLCAHFDSCMRTTFDGFSNRKLKKNTPRCFETCPDFREAVCARLASAPFVCNGCEAQGTCPLPKKFYSAAGAQANYEGIRSNSRAGVHPDDETVRTMNAVITPCLRRGQSIRNIIANNEALFGKYAESTVYGWINSGLFDARTSDLPYAHCSRRKPRRKLETKTNAKCRVNRTYKDYVAWMLQHEGTVACELDTVIGSISGKVLFTMIFPESGLSLAFLRDAKTAQTTTRIFNMLWEVAGPKLFVRLFAVILTDNGTEFSDPGMIENYRPDPVHNPTKLVPRGVRVFYCDPYCSSQKPHIERVHIEIRRVLQKGTSFNALTQDGVNEVMSHVNSYTRESLDNETPYDRFVRMYGKDGSDFLDRIGIHRVAANQVTLHPFLLGQRFQRLADKAILRKNGVTATKKQTSGK